MCDIFKECRKAFNKKRNKNGSQINGGSKACKARLKFLTMKLAQWARDIVAKSGFCWIYIAIQTDYVLRLK